MVLKVLNILFLQVLEKMEIVYVSNEVFFNSQFSHLSNHGVPAGKNDGAKHGSTLPC